jgi:hypothetical protein
VTINGAQQYQRIDGFGASEAFGQAETVMNAPAPVQRQVLSLLYSPTSGAGLTILRNEISADPGITIEPNAPSSPNATPTYLPLSAVDEDQGQLWFAQQIKADYGVTNVFADAWSAPAFMKTNDSPINGGTLCGVPGATCASGDWRQAYANYLAQYARDYAEAGDPLSYVGPENEANIGPGYDSMISHEPGPECELHAVSRPDARGFAIADASGVLRHRGLGLRSAVCSSDRGRPARELLHPAVHEPRLHGPAQLAPHRLEQAGLGDRVVHVPTVGPGLG